MCSPTILIYVDDMAVTKNNDQVITNLKKYLHTQFHMKDMGESSSISWVWKC